MKYEDLKNYRYIENWIKDQTEYIESCKETINRLTAVLGEQTKGSKRHNDAEAERLVQLEDSFKDLTAKIITEQERQKKIVNRINLLDFPYANILFKHYILGKKLREVASDLKLDYEYTKKMNGRGIKKFLKLSPKGTEKHL